MASVAWLTESLRELLGEERALLERAVAVLSGWESSSADVEQLRRALAQLDELFLLVVVGEFNSGKSALINALLGQAILPEGPTPTTDRVYILCHGEASGREILDENVHVLRYPVDILRYLHIVDTPGTNAVLRHHETITRDFVPRSDLVVFVTSADRPFTESERAFLEAIREWGKKVVLVINKGDLLDSSVARAEVETFVRTQVRRLLGFEPELFVVSARAGLKAPASEAAEGFRQLSQYLRSTLTGQQLVTLKLSSPLGVVSRLVVKHRQAAAERMQVVAEDLEALRQVEQGCSAYQSQMQAEFESRRSRIENDLLQMSLRGEAFFDDHMRLLRLRSMLRAEAMRAAFEREVVADTPEKVAAHVQELIDWLVEREQDLWRRAALELNRRRETAALREATREAIGGFAYSRKHLLDQVGIQAESILHDYDRRTEAERIAVSVQESVAMMGLVEASALGLGLVLKALLTTAAADATGVLAAGLLGLAGLAIIPWRRSVAKREFRRKMDELRRRLASTLAESFQRELGRSLDRLGQAIAPYRTFVFDEEDRLRRVLAELDDIAQCAIRLRSAVEQAAAAG